MKYLYTNEPDEGCHKINGVYGRPVHSHEQKALKAKGWTEYPDELRKEEVKQEAEEGQVDEDLVAAYKAVYGKAPHHKMKPETIRAKLDEAYDD